MPRPYRINCPGLLYHIISRGNNKELIFQDDFCYKKFIDLLSICKSKHAFKLYAFCLMPNHIHLLIETAQAVSLSKIMQVLLTRYTMYYNYRYQRVGHLFQGRYKSIVVEKETYLFALTRYIHLNPVRANITQDPSSYQWSSYNKYLKGENDELVETQFVLDILCEEKSTQAKLYQSIIEDIPDEMKNQRLFCAEKNEKGFFLGSKEFIDKIINSQRLSDLTPKG